MPPLPPINFSSGPEDHADRLELIGGRGSGRADPLSEKISWGLAPTNSVCKWDTHFRWVQIKTKKTGRRDPHTGWAFATAAFTRAGTRAGA